MLSLVIPVFNEKDNIDELIQRVEKSLKDYSYEIIFVDDSNDETTAIISQFACGDQRIKLIHRKNKTGLASAVICGFENAQGDILAVMDGDLQHPPEILPKMMKEIEQGADLVVPSRFIPGGSDGGLNHFRKLVSATARYIGKILIKSLRRASDHTGGMFMLRKEVIQGKQLNPVGWKILMEIMVMGSYQNLVEIPYVFSTRNLGQSKLNLKVQLQYVWHIIGLLKRSESDRRFYVFCLVGGSGVLVDMLIFAILGYRFPGMSVNAKAVVSAFIAMVSNYTLNNLFTWKEIRGIKFNYKAFLVNLRRFSKYLMVSSFGILIKSIILFLLYYFLHINKYWGNFAGIVCASFSNYFLSKLWVWREEKASFPIYKRVGEKNSSGVSAKK
ncbi:glycosyltransferase, group 2 family protein [Desulfitobacterium hafniense DP7]|uniref:Glycosyltransferase, group 2 family protein n=1 Tax=Desulfitobacterium hafniense DP7 TaxID=537010 RepID=G9XKS1_DESHA|nr:glycosyltransferase family 2 protein [Desulfitobacterium hafniense]EHL07748.1 glycosyltransferase, group 2 family protein [Desulfitobacterium hafniense DP7]